MAKVSESVNDTQLGDVVTTLLGGIEESPTVIVGVQRLCNIGNFENVAVHCAIKLPVGVDYHSLGTDIESAINYGFHIVSTETAKRYNKVSVFGSENQEESTSSR